jgi:hypothetical protein
MPYYRPRHIQRDNTDAIFGYPIHTHFDGLMDAIWRIQIDIMVNCRSLFALTGHVACATLAHVILVEEKPYSALTRREYECSSRLHCKSSFNKKLSKKIVKGKCIVTNLINRMSTEHGFLDGSG